jgi:ribulose-bisphosphate carboxylase small chain
MMAFDSSRGVETIVMSFIVNRPASEPGFMLERQEVNGRSIQYSTRGYGAGRPEGERY